MAAFTPISSLSDMQLASVWDELARAVWERRLFIGAPLFAYPAGGVFVGPGQDKHKVFTGLYLGPFSPRVLQDTVLAMINSGRFLRSSTVPDTADGFSVYDSSSISQFWEDAGMSPGGFRCATNWDPDSDTWQAFGDAMWSRTGNGHGLFSAGDIWGPWLIVDLQAALTRLSLIRGRHNYNDFWSVESTTTTLRKATGIATSWAEATADLAAKWPEVTSTAPGHYPGSYCIGSIPSSYEAYAEARRSQLVVQLDVSFIDAALLVQAAAIGCDVHWYAYAKPPSGGVDNTYDSAGTGLIQDVYTRFSSTPLSSSERQYSAMLGLIDLPAVSAEPPPAKARGYEVRQSAGTAVILQPSYSHGA